MDKTDESMFSQKKPSDAEETLRIEICHMASETEETTSEMALIITSLIEITRKTNKSFGAMIMITYTNCLFLSTISLFLTSSMIINRYQGIELLLIAIARLFVAGLSITRLFFITITGQGLASAMKQCLYRIKRNQIEAPCSDKTTKEKLDSIYQLLKDNSHSPITPISAFSLSNRTLLGIIATILTYLIVLIRFKSSKNEMLGFFDETPNRNLTLGSRNQLQNMSNK